MASKLSTQVGKTLAHLQDAMDQVVAFGFKSLKQSANKKPKKTDSTLKKTWLKTAGFLGEAGSSFYETYEEIKKKREEK